ncbi:hypothetical protein M9458_049918, partial [Cirrhinus mrigala]
WSAWSECNKSCGKGHMIRSRMVKLEPQRSRGRNARSASRQEEETGSFGKEESKTEQGVCGRGEL